MLVWGLVIAVARLAPGLRRAADPRHRHPYADVFRGLPAIINIYLSASACR